MMIGEYMLKHHRGHYFAKSQNLTRQLTAAYDDALRRYDLLLMPTLPMVAPPIPGPDATLALYIQRAFEMITNTAPFDITGHPSMSIPCGLSDGLPVGLMLTGKHYDEATIYRAARFRTGRRLADIVAPNRSSTDRGPELHLRWRSSTRLRSAMLAFR